MPVPHSLLALLSTEASAHGFALKRRYDALLGGERDLKAGQVYSTLTRLARDGLAEDVGVESGGAAERRLYAITAAGRAEVDRWLLAPSLPAGRPSDVFTRVVLALAMGRDVDALLDAQRTLYLERLRALRSANNIGGALARLSADFEAAHLAADLEWIATASARTAQLRTDLIGEPS